MTTMKRTVMTTRTISLTDEINISLFFVFTSWIWSLVRIKDYFYATKTYSEVTYKVTYLEATIFGWWFVAGR